jgi:hypothetical protein
MLLVEFKQNIIQYVCLKMRGKLDVQNLCTKAAAFALYFAMFELLLYVFFFAFN